VQGFPVILVVLYSQKGLQVGKLHTLPAWEKQP